MWTEITLTLTPAEELAIAVSNGTAVDKLSAWKRYCAKKWYERVVLQTRVELDLQQLEPQDSTEVVQLRYLIGNHPPWLEIKETNELAQSTPSG